MNNQTISLADLKAKYGAPPADLTVEMRGAKVLLRSGDMTVEMAVPFGVIAWDDVLYRYALPALAQFQR
jgi:hypothetical protein